MWSERSRVPIEASLFAQTVVSSLDLSRNKKWTSEGPTHWYIVQKSSIHCSQWQSFHFISCVHLEARKRESTWIFCDQRSPIQASLPWSLHFPPICRVQPEGIIRRASQKASRLSSSPLGKGRERREGSDSKAALLSLSLLHSTFPSEGIEAEKRGQSEWHWLTFWPPITARGRSDCCEKQYDHLWSNITIHPCLSNNPNYKGKFQLIMIL